MKVACRQKEAVSRAYSRDDDPRWASDESRQASTPGSRCVVDQEKTLLRLEASDQLDQRHPRNELRHLVLTRVLRRHQVDRHPLDALHPKYLSHGCSIAGSEPSH